MATHIHITPAGPSGPNLGPDSTHTHLTGWVPSGIPILSGGEHYHLTGTAPSGLNMAVPTNQTLPSVIGNPVVGADSQGTIGIWTYTAGPLVYSFQWTRGDTGAAIVGATNSDYVPQMTDLGHTLVLQVTAYDSGQSYASAMASSVASPPIALPSTRPWSMSQLALDVLTKLVVTPVGQSPASEDMTYVQRVYASRFANLRTEGLAPWAINSIPTEAQQAVSRIIAAECCDAYGISGQRRIEIDAMAQAFGWSVLRREYAAEPKRLPIRTRYY